MAEPRVVSVVGMEGDRNRGSVPEMLNSWLLHFKVLNTGDNKQLKIYIYILIGNHQCMGSN